MSIPSAPPPPPELGGVVGTTGDVVGVEPPGVGPPGVEPPGVEPPGVGPTGVDPPGVGPTGVESPGMVPLGVEVVPVPGVVGASLGPEAPLLLIRSAIWSLYTLPSTTFC